MNGLEQCVDENVASIDDYLFLNEDEQCRLYIKPKVDIVVKELREKINSVIIASHLQVDVYFVSNIPYSNGAPDLERLKLIPYIGQDTLDSVIESNIFLDCELTVEDSSPSGHKVPIGKYQEYEKSLHQNTKNNDDNLSSSLFESSNEPSLIRGKKIRKDWGATTFQDILLRSLETDNNNTITFIKGDQEQERISYKALLYQSRQILQQLFASGVTKQDIIVLPIMSSVTFIKIFWACMLGGIVVLPQIPVKNMDRSDETINNLHYLAGKLDRLTIIAGSNFLTDLQRYSDSGNSLSFSGIPIDDLLSNHTLPEGPLPKCNPNSNALILMTSGSTGGPKLVMHTQSALIARSYATIEHNHFSSDDITLNWFGFDHVGALVMFHIRDCVAGASQIHVSTHLILEKPTRWLSYLTQYRATVTWAPNFAFALIVDQLASTQQQYAFDLTALRFILNGGESIHYDTASAFLKALSPYGLCEKAMHPAWGMSETASGVVYADNLCSIKSKTGLHYTSIGWPIPGYSIRVVNNENKTLPKGRSGKLQVKGPSVCLEYYQNNTLTRLTHMEDGWFDSGDVAAITDQGLCIVGREKDMLIINGENYSCVSLEDNLRTINGVVSDGVCLLPLFNHESKKDEMVLFLSTRPQEDWLPIMTTSRQMLLKLTGLAPLSIISIPEASMPRTSIGKVKKSLLKDQYLVGAFSDSISLYNQLYPNDCYIKDWFFETDWLEKEIIFNSLKDNQLLIIVNNVSELNHRITKAIKQHSQIAIMSRNDFLSYTGTTDFLGLIVIDSVQASQQLPITDIAYEHYPLARVIGNSFNHLQFINYIRITDIDIHHIDSDGIASMANAFFQSFSSESKHLNCTTMFVTEKNFSQAADIKSTLSKIGSPAREQKIYLQDDRCFVSILNKLECHLAAKKNPLNSSHFYIITGGLGGIGYAIAQDLLRNGATHLLLLGRREPSAIDNYNALMSKLDSLGGSATYLPVDLADYDNILEKVDIYARELQMPLGKVIHSAGEFHMKSIQDEDWNSVFEVLRPKILGTKNLIKLCQQYSGCELINFSSVNGFFGGAHASAYAIANAFQGAVAHKYDFVRTLSWSMWKNIGMSRAVDLAELTSHKGYELISLQQGLASFSICQKIMKKNILIGINQSNRYMSTWINNTVYNLESLVCHNKIIEPTRSKLKDKYGANINIAYSFKSKYIDNDGPSDQGILEHIKDIWKSVLKVESISENDNFFDLGGHSLLLPQLLLAYKNELRIEVKPVDVFHYPTIKLFAGFATSRIDGMTFDKVTDSVKKVWMKLLSLNELNSKENFFDLGAHSLMIPEAQRELSSLMNAELAMVDIFKYPNVESLSIHICKQKKIIRDPEHQATLSHHVVKKRKSLMRHHINTET